MAGHFVRFGFFAAAIAMSIVVGPHSWALAAAFGFFGGAFFIFALTPSRPTQPKER